LHRVLEETAERASEAFALFLREPGSGVGESSDDRLHCVELLNALPDAVQRGLLGADIAIG
jgi:hypothetical protein